VTAVEADSPAAAAGVLAGDVVRSLADKPTPTVADFHLGLVGRAPGRTVRLELLREGKPVKASLTLGRRPKPDGAALLRRKLGLTAVPLSEQKAKAMSLQVPRGVLITAVDPAFFATVDHQPAPGDVLGRIAKSRPRDLDHLGLILEKLRPGEPVSMVLLRRKNKTATRLDITLTLPK
jgi:serine protease Do